MKQYPNIPTDEVVKQAACFPRDRLGEPLGLDPEKYDLWLGGKITRSRIDLLENLVAMSKTFGGHIPQATLESLIDVKLQLLEANEAKQPTEL